MEWLVSDSGRVWTLDSIVDEWSWDWDEDWGRFIRRYWERIDEWGIIFIEEFSIDQLKHTRLYPYLYWRVGLRLLRLESFHFFLRDHSFLFLALSHLTDLDSACLVKLMEEGKKIWSLSHSLPNHCSSMNAKTSIDSWWTTTNRKKKARLSLVHLH